MASANMLSTGSPAVTKLALGQNVAASGSILTKSTFTGVCIPVSSSRVPRRAQRKVCMSVAKDEDKKVSAPLKKSLAAGLLAATIATSSAPAYADILPDQPRWGNIVQKVEKASKKVKSAANPVKDTLNQKNPLVDATAGKIAQKPKANFGSGNRTDGFNRQNVSFTEAPPLRFVGLDTKGTPADPETVKDDAVGGVTDPGSIPGRIQDRASTIASKLGNLVPDFSKPDTKGTPADPETVKDDTIGGITDPGSIPGRVKDRADNIASKLGNLKPNLPNADKAIPGNKGVKDLAPDLVEGSSEKIPQKKGGYASGISFTSSPPLVFVGLDTKGTPADPETVKDDAIGGVTDPASIPGRIQERAGTIASKLGNLVPDFSKPDTKGTPADPETVKDDAIGGVTDPGSIPGRIKERAGTIASKAGNLNVDKAIPGNKGVKDLAPDLVEGSSEKIPQKKGGYAATGFYNSPPLVYVGLDTKGTPADPETVKDDAIGGVTDPGSIPGRVQDRASTIASKLGSLVPDFGKADTKGTPADPETVKDDAIGGVTDPGSIPGRVKDRAVTIASKVGNATPDLPNADNKNAGGKPSNLFGTGPKGDRRSAPIGDLSLNIKGTPLDPETVKDDAIGGVTDPASIPGRIKQRANTIGSKLPNLPNADKVIPGDKGIKDVAPDIVEGSSQKIPQLPRATFGTYNGTTNRTNVSFIDAPTLQFVGLDTRGTPADPETVKDDAIGGITDPASIPGRIKQRANTVASKLPNLPNVDKVIPGDKGIKDVAPDIVEGSSNKIPQRPRATFGTYNGTTNRTNVDFSAAPALQFVGLDTKGTPADPETVKDDAIGGVTDPGSIPGRIKERANTIASKLPNLPNADQIIPGKKGVKDIAPDIVEGSSEKIPQRSAPSYGSQGAETNRTNVDFTSPSALRFVGLDTKGTPADPETVKDDAIGGITDPGSIPGRIKERVGTIASKLPNLPNADQILPGDKGIKDVAPDIVEGSSKKIPQLNAPSLGPQNPDTNRTNVSVTSTPTLQFVGLDIKGTPADPNTVKDDAIGGITDPGSIPGRIKERADTIASKLPNLPNADKVVPGDKGIKDVAPDIVEGSSKKIPQLNAPGLGPQTPDTNRTNVDLTSTPTLQFVGLDTKGTPADPNTVKDDAIGGITDPGSIPGRIKERAGTIASKLPNLPNADQILPGDKGIKDVAPDIVEGSSKKIPQLNAPGLGPQTPDTNRTNVNFTSTPTLQFVADIKGTPADPETVKDDVVGGVTDPASIPGRIKERANTIASKLPNLPNANEVIPGKKGVKDIAPDLVEGSSQKIPQRSAQSTN